MKQHGKKKLQSTWAAIAYQEGGDDGFVRTLVYAVRTAAQSIAGATLVPLPLHGPEQMQVQVLVQVPKPLLVPMPVRLVVPLLLPKMVLLVELVPVSEQVPVSMPDPPVDQPDPLTRSMPNPQLD